MIQTVQHELEQKIIGLMHRSTHDLYYAEEYIKDKVTIFRFLKDSKFSKEETIQRLFDTIQWRLDHQVDILDYRDCIEFYEKGCLAFFNKQDKSGQPLLFVRLRYFPTEINSKPKLSEHIRRYSSLMMEIARRLTWDITREKEEAEELYPLKSQITVIVDISKAPMIPIDKEIISTMEMILSSRFPGIVGSINVLNFSWLYQGLWSVVKYFLNEQQKESIQFASMNDIKEIVDINNILTELGGCDSYSWTIESDSVLNKYGIKRNVSLPIELSYTPPISISNNSLIDEDTFSEDEFFDAHESISPSPKASPLALPTSIIPASKSSTEIIVNSPIQQPLSKVETIPHTTSRISFRSIQPEDILLFWKKPYSSARLRTTTKPPISSQKTNYLEKNEDDCSDSSIIVVKPSSLNQNQLLSPRRTFMKLRHQHLMQIQFYFKTTVDQLIQAAFGSRGIAYWIAVYLFLRGPVESVVSNTISKTSLVRPQMISNTAIGITAVMAAVISSSISNMLETLKNL